MIKIKEKVNYYYMVYLTLWFLLPPIVQGILCLDHHGLYRGHPRSFLLEILSSLSISAYQIAVIC